MPSTPIVLKEVLDLFGIPLGSMELKDYRRIQRLFWFLQRNGVNLRFYSYGWTPHGPYCKALTDNLEQAEKYYAMMLEKFEGCT